MTKLVSDMFKDRVCIVQHVGIIQSYNIEIVSACADATQPMWLRVVLLVKYIMQCI